ncbi:FAD-dependent monooxygenase [Spiractinospora alimapuensis]|uniref:FAD-dependent monooxygenase n=1 Tax=Spiractinospora alimapuensis TaxID=2820884 RepID=UPI001F266C0C|nr:FAD-dependent monooxygenase [Spiractinospora alimapuensis]QVQ51173.1 FAD-dependent monooxygenase [Spiractinospora alimapuensis]
MTVHARVPSTPVLVLGNGPVGQTTALLLARWGVPTIVVDERPGRDLVGSKAICQQRDVLDIWESVGAGGRIAAEGTTWSTARTFFRDRELFSVTVPDGGQSSFPPFVNLSQSRSEEILDECVAAEPRIDVRWSHRATAIEQDDEGVTVTCATPTGEVRLRATHVVACCGAHTEVRRMLGVGFEGHSFTDQFLICDIRADLPGWVEERRFYFDPEWNPGRQVLIHPCPDSTFRVDWQVPPEYDLAAEEADGRLDARIRKIIGDRPYEVVWKSVYRFHSRVAERMRVGRVLLAGDCAHLYAPFGARGLNSGVGDAENAAWKLAYVRRGWAHESLLDSYHHERYAAARENLEITTATMDFLVPHSEEQRRHRREVLERAVHDSSAHPLVDSGRLAEAFWYVASPLTTEDRTRPFPGRPARGTLPTPGPGILTPDLPVTHVDGSPGRLRAMAREGFLILTAGPDAHRGAQVAVERALSGPVRVLKAAELDPSGRLAEALGMRDGELWVVRPDAYVAAVVDSPERLEVAAHRAVGRRPPRGSSVIPRQKEVGDGVLPARR